MHGGPAPGTKNMVELSTGMDAYENNTAANWKYVTLAEGGEQTPYKHMEGVPIEIYEQIPKSLDIFPAREGEGKRKKRDVGINAKIVAYKYQLDGDFTDEDIDREEGSSGNQTEQSRQGDIRLTDRLDPCLTIKQVFVGFKKWSKRFIGNCGGQFYHEHQVNRCLKFYNYFIKAAKDANMCLDLNAI